MPKYLRSRGRSATHGLPVRARLESTLDVRAIRNQTGLSQSQIAKLVEVPVRTWQNWEQGRREPTGPARALLRAMRNDSKAVLTVLRPHPGN